MLMWMQSAGPGNQKKDSELETLGDSWTFDVAEMNEGKALDSVVMVLYHGFHFL